jgi:hypothetical protein
MYLQIRTDLPDRVKNKSVMYPTGKFSIGLDLIALASALSESTTLRDEGGVAGIIVIRPGVRRTSAMDPYGSMVSALRE